MPKPLSPRPQAGAHLTPGAPMPKPLSPRLQASARLVFSPLVFSPLVFSLVVPSLVALSLLAPATAAAKDGAKDRPMADHERTLSVAAVRLTNPMVLLDYEQALSDKTSFSVGAGYGRYNSLLLRLLNDIGDEIGGEADVTLRIRQLSANGSFNYYFKGFNRGWYTGGTLEYGRYTLRVEGDDALVDSSVDRYSTLKAAPHIGYKIATEKGFTFAWDTGLGYQVGFGEASGLALVGGLNLGWSF